MCGIVGLAKPEKEIIAKMTHLVAHRGPDGKKAFCDKHVSLGHTRLAIIDPQPHADQPFVYKHYVMTYNGEIYNFREIRKQLENEGYTFKTESDTEVILAAYDFWKEKCLDQFNGMFAFCIYDKEKKTFFLARDRFGIKPLYFSSTTEHGFAFASEIKALMPLLKEIVVDKVALEQFFNLRYTVAPRTMLKDVQKVGAGEYLQVDLASQSVTKTKWYDFQKNVKEEFKGSYEQAQEQLSRILEKSVRRRMVADVPVGSFLSGGLDSSTIAALAARENENFNTFSIGFETTNELSYAKQVAEHIGSTHHEHEMDQATLLQDIDKIIYHMDEPIGDPGFIPIFHLAKFVKEKHSVVLSGDGADEILAGYDRYKLLHYGRYLKNFVPFSSSNQIAKKLQTLNKEKTSDKQFFSVSGLFDSSELAQMGFSSIDTQSMYKVEGSCVVKNAMLTDMHHVIPEDFLMKADKMCSAWGLEQRVPFLDHEVVEFCFSLPTSFKLKMWNEKRILKDVARPLIPEQIISRPKHGFNVPIDHWFQNELGTDLLELLENKRHELYNSDNIKNLLNELKDSSNGYKSNFVIAQKLWSVYVFEKWFEDIKNGKKAG